MRYVYIVLVLAVTALVLLFTIQNIHSTTVTLFQIRVTMPVSILVVLVYALGMLTGGFVLSLLRNWIHRASEEPPHGSPP
jgi:lipopolysaccharide assembly protein A